MVWVDLAEYYGTDHWLETSWLARIRAGHCCEVCGAPDDLEPLHVHHITYVRLWCELPDDLVVLCWSCHGDVHAFPRIRFLYERTARFSRERRLAA